MTNNNDEDDDNVHRVALIENLIKCVTAGVNLRIIYLFLIKFLD